MVKVVDDLNSNYKVGTMKITLRESNKFNEEILECILDKYQCLYNIEIVDMNGSVDSKVHDLIKQIVVSSTLTSLVVDISGSLKDTDEGF